MSTTLNGYCATAAILLAVTLSHAEAQTATNAASSRTSPASEAAATSAASSPIPGDAASSSKKAKRQRAVKASSTKSGQKPGVDANHE